MPVRSYKDLKVWQRAIELVEVSYRIAARLPPMERFGLAAQIQRAAVSVAANIAEGHGRLGRGEFVHHVSIARGSLKELETHLYIMLRLGTARDEDTDAAFKLTDEISRMLTALVRKLPPRRGLTTDLSALSAQR